MLVSIEKMRSAVRLLEPVGLREVRLAMRAGRRFGYLPRHPLDARRALRSTRLSVVPDDIDLRAGLVVDVGANEGEWTAGVLRLVPDAQILLAEPAPSCARRLRARFAQDRNVTIAEVALSDRAGVAAFHVTAHSHNSSLQRPRDMNPLYHHGWEEIDEVVVETTTLDDLLGDRPASLLKIDVQGAEASVLRGGSEALARARAVLIEVTTQSHYEGDSLFPALHEQMDGLGYSLAGLSEPFLDPTGRALWFDACYTNGRLKSAASDRTT